MWHVPPRAVPGPRREQNAWACPAPGCPLQTSLRSTPARLKPRLPRARRAPRHRRTSACDILVTVSKQLVSFVSPRVCRSSTRVLEAAKLHVTLSWWRCVVTCLSNPRRRDTDRDPNASRGCHWVPCVSVGSRWRREPGWAASSNRSKMESRLTFSKFINYEKDPQTAKGAPRSTVGRGGSSPGSGSARVTKAGATADLGSLASDEHRAANTSGQGWFAGKQPSHGKPKPVLTPLTRMRAHTCTRVHSAGQRLTPGHAQRGRPEALPEGSPS